MKAKVHEKVGGKKPKVQKCIEMGIHTDRYFNVGASKGHECVLFSLVHSSSSGQKDKGWGCKKGGCWHESTDTNRCAVKYWF